MILLMDRSVFEEKSSSKMPGGFDNKPQEYIYCYNEIYNLFNESLFAISKFLKGLIYTKNYNRRSRMFHGKTTCWKMVI